MPYATQQDLVERFGAEELAELTGGETIDPREVAVALADADAEVEGYLAARYAVPVSPVPPLLRRVAADVARFRLHKGRATEAVRQAYEDATKLLRDLADGRAALAGAAPAGAGASPAAAAGEVRVAGPARRMPPTIQDFFG